MCSTKYLFGYICIAVVIAVTAFVHGANTTLPFTYGGQVLQGDGSQTCPSEAQRERLRNEVDIATLRLLRESVVPLLQGYSCGGSTGWRRVAYLDMADPSLQCPSAWREITTPHRVCGRRSTSASCEGVTYTTGSEHYDHVCGRIIGYQVGPPSTFRGSNISINDFYFEGVSLTHGFPRQHIWTFSAGADEQSFTCPCVNGSTAQNRIPSFVGQNYFCESGLTRWNGTTGIFWPDGDPLWDGQGCGPTSSCCTFNSPPWFNVQLSSPTTDNIEVRICATNGFQIEDTPIEHIELYVK